MSGIETEKGRSRRRLLPRDEVLGWTRYAWLFWLPTALIDPIVRTRAGDVPLWLWPVTIAALFAFVVSYFRAYWHTPRFLWIVVFQAALGVALTPINTGASVFFVYSASFAAQLPDPKRALRFVIGITLAAALTALVFNAPLYFWFGSVLLSPLIGGINLHFSQVDRARRSLKLAHNEIEHLATVAERERIARDLHDVLGHTLSLIVLKSELAAKLADRDPARAAAEIRDVEAVARKALQEVREALRGYRATLPDEVERARSLLKAADIDSHFEVASLALPRAYTEALSLALREATTNVARHARARTCRISIRQTGASVRLEVEDDGRGGDAPEGAGLRGMRERIMALGGSVERRSGRGVQLIVTMPVPSHNANDESSGIVSGGTAA